MITFLAIVGALSIVWYTGRAVSYYMDWRDHYNAMRDAAREHDKNCEVCKK